MDCQQLGTARSCCREMDGTRKEAPSACQCQVTSTNGAQLTNNPARTQASHVQPTEVQYDIEFHVTHLTVILTTHAGAVSCSKPC